MLAVLYVVFVGVGKSDHDHGSDSASTHEHHVTSPLPPPPTTQPTEGPFAALAAMLPETLDGYRINTGAKATGELDLEKAASAEQDTSAEKALLETRHFERGYGRGFTNDTVDVYTAVYDFASDQDASFYLTDGFINLHGKGASTYDVPEIAGAKGFSHGAEDEGVPAIVHGVAFTKGDRFFLAFTRSPSNSTPAQVKTLANDIAARA